MQDQRTLNPEASVLPGSPKDKEKWRLGKKNDLSELVESELEQLLSEYPLTQEEVGKVGLAIRKQQQKQKDKGDASNAVKSYTSQDLDSPRTQLALRLNSASKGLAKMRFSLVPSRLKEPIFWDATIFLVKERLMQYNASCQGVPPTEGLLTMVNNQKPTNKQVTSPNQQQKIPAKSKPASKVPQNGGLNGKNGSVASLEKQLAMKDAEIAELKKQVADLQRVALDIATLPNNNTQKPQKSKNAAAHKGAWVMDQDSQQFLAYPEEVKAAMRQEKQKRLRQVEQELKFILDSDNGEDSHGQWDCCGSSEYKSDCLKK